MLEVGDCITILTERGPHLFILLTEPCGDPLGAAYVNLTSYKSNPESDTTVVLVSGHSFIRRKTVANYLKSNIVDCNKLQAKINDQQDQTSFHRERKCSEELLQILREGLRNSPNTPPKVVKYCEDKF